MTGLLDTNVALYLLGGRLAEPLPTGSYGVSIITEMELLAWPSLTTEEEENVREFLNRLVICELTPSIRARAVQLRRQKQLKLPDAIVCATAIEFGVELWTNDTSLVKVPGLTCRTARLLTAWRGLVNSSPATCHSSLPLFADVTFNDSTIHVATA